MRYLVLVSLFGAACGGAPSAPKDPAGGGKPPEKADPPAVAEAKPKAPADCEPAGPMDEKAAVTYAERAIPEARALAKQSEEKLVASSSERYDREAREAFLRDAASTALTALQADPYSVHATYTLAAVYARAGARQCAVNMLARLTDLQAMTSQKAIVTEHVDRLLGRTQVPDPYFSDLRKEEAFKNLATAFVAGRPIDAPAVAPKPAELELEHPKALPVVPVIDDAPAPGAKAPGRARATLKVLEARGQGSGLVLTLDCGGQKLGVGAKGVLVGPKGPIANGGVTISAVRGKECEAKSPLGLAAYPKGATAVFDAP